MIGEQLHQSLANHSRCAQNSCAPLSAVSAAVHRAPRPCADSRSAFTISCCSSGLIFAAPHQIVPPKCFGRGLNEKTHRPVRFGGGLETFSRWLAVSPVARSALSGRSPRLSRRNRRLRRGPDPLRFASQHNHQDIMSQGNSERKLEIPLIHAAKGKSLPLGQSIGSPDQARRSRQ
jgi:hypothetical protein